MTMDPAPTQRRVRVPLVAAAGVTLVLLATLGAWLLLRGSGEGEAEPPPRAPAELASTDELRALAARADGPVFWAGPQPGMRYEVSETSDGRVYVRYLPVGVEPGDPRAEFLTVGTYPEPDALEVVRRRGGEERAVLRELANGGLAVYSESSPTSVYVAYPAIPRLVEVFDPSAERAQDVAFSDRIVPVVPEHPDEQTGQPVAATTEELREAARGVDHPVYWLGPREGVTYELTRLPNGQVYVRYLPEGAEVGDPRAEFETVGTYPAPTALATLERTSGDDAERFDLPNGGRAFASRATPTTVHFSFPDADYEVEVYHPEAGRAEELVRGGAVVPIR